VLQPAALVAASLVAQRAQETPLLLGVRRHHAALARRHLLVRVEGEDRARAVRAERCTAIDGAERLTRILDEREAVLVRDRAQLVELARVAVDVDRDDRLRPRRDRSLYRTGIEVQRACVDVREHRDPALVDEAVRAGRERVRRRDHLVSRPDAGGDAEEMEPGGARRHRGCVRRADPCGEELLEPVDGWTEREPAGAHHLEHELFLALVQVRPRKRDRAGLLLHALARLGAYSSHWAQRALRPCTVSR
jgi:hypothetical protein